MCMDDDGTIQDIFNAEAFVIESGPGISLICEQRYQVSCVLRVHGHGWIIMVSGIHEIVGTVTKLVDVHSIEVGRSSGSDIGKSKNFCFNQYTAIRGVVEFDQSADGRGCSTSADPCHGAWLILRKQMDKSHTRGWLLCVHKDSLLKFTIRICGERMD